MFAAAKRQRRKYERFDCAFQIDKIELPFLTRSPMGRACHFPPQQDSKAAFFFSRRWNENTAQLENCDALRARANVSLKRREQARNQTWSQRDMIFAQRIAQLDR